jgi:hypothetical protein
MMDDYEVLNITSCRNCPFMNDDHLICIHPMRNAAPDFRYLTPEEASGQEQPPSWCPLRKAALVIDLKHFKWNGG